MSQFVCPACRSRIPVSVASAGAFIRCPACDESIPSPLPASAEPPVPAAAPPAAPLVRRPHLLIPTVAMLLLGSILGGMFGAYLWNPAKKSAHTAKAEGDNRPKPPAEKPAERPVEPKAELPAEPEVEPKVVPPSTVVKAPLPEKPALLKMLTFPLGVPRTRVEELFFTPQGKIGWLSTRSDSVNPTQQLHVIDPSAPAVRTELPAPRFAPCRRSLAPDGKFFAMETRAGNRIHISIWEVGNAQPIVRDWSLPPHPEEKNPEGVYRGFSLVANDQLLTVTAAGTLEWWQLPTMERVKKVQVPGPLAFAMPVVSPDRRRCALYDRGRFHIVDLEAGAPLCVTAPRRALAGRTSVFCSAAAFSPDGTKLAAVLTNAAPDPAVFCYDTTTGQSIAPAAPKPREHNPAHFRLGWFGSHYFFLHEQFVDGPVSVYRVGDTAPSAELTFAAKAGVVGIGAPDDRFWYVPPAEAPAADALLIGVRLPAFAQAALPDQPVTAKLGAAGLVR